MVRLDDSVRVINNVLSLVNDWFDCVGEMGDKEIRFEFGVSHQEFCDAHAAKGLLHETIVRDLCLTVDELIDQIADNNVRLVGLMSDDGAVRLFTKDRLNHLMVPEIIDVVLDALSELAL